MNLLFSRPFTWIVVVIGIVYGIFFYWWFQPSFLLSLSVVLLVVFSIALWLFLFLKTGEDSSGKKKTEDQSKIDAKQLLSECSDEFRKPVLECFDLTNRIRKDFKQEDFQSEISNLLFNLNSLIQNHHKLYIRSSQFGTKEQKKDMKSILENQINSASTTLNSLKSFSGNLTLLDVNTNAGDEIHEELKFINQALAEVIEEI